MATRSVYVLIHCLSTTIDLPVVVFAFSAGPRACIGQRFAMAESLCILVCIVRRYIILPPTDVLGLDVEKQEEILTRWKPGVTVIPTNARVRFKRRAS